MAQEFETLREVAHALEGIRDQLTLHAKVFGASVFILAALLGFYGVQILEIRGSLGTIEGRLDGVDITLGRIDTRVAGVEARLSGLEERMSRIEAIVERIDANTRRASLQSEPSTTEASGQGTPPVSEGDIKDTIQEPSQRPGLPALKQGTAKPETQFQQ